MSVHASPHQEVPAATSGRAARAAKAYCVVDCVTRDDGDFYRVWIRTSANPEIGLLHGEYASLEAATATLRVEWREAAASGLVVWGLLDAWSGHPAEPETRRS